MFNNRLSLCLVRNLSLFPGCICLYSEWFPTSGNDIWGWRWTARPSEKHRIRKLMPKIKKTLTQRKKEALLKKQGKELESLCKKCGLCCHIKVGLSDGSFVVHPFMTCKYLSVDNRCTVYEKRFLCDSKICFTRQEMITKDFLLPEGCPYTQLRQGYKSARIVTQAEFDDIVVHELEVGNYNILLADRAF